MNRVGWLVDANGSDGDPETLPGRGEPAKFAAVAVAVAVPSEPTPKPYI